MTPASTPAIQPTKPPRDLQCECGKLLPDEKAHAQHKQRFGRKGHRLVKNTNQLEKD